MAGIAALLSPVTSAVAELRKEARCMDGNATDLNAALSERLELLEQRMTVTDVRVEKLENLYNDLLQCPSVDADTLEKKMRDGIDDCMRKDAG